MFASSVISSVVIRARRVFTSNMIDDAPCTVSG